jgi:ribonuclease VapC
VIVVDTSALFAIAAQEDERDMFVETLEESKSVMCSTVTYVETIMVLTGRSRRLARSRVDEMFDMFLIKLAPVDRALADAAINAFEQFGKGRHPARLNLADCFSYALAKSRGLPLLFKGDDFAKTDIVPAWRP